MSFLSVVQLCRTSASGNAYRDSGERGVASGHGHLFVQLVEQRGSRERESAMGKGGEGGSAGGDENMAAWLVAVNTLKILPFKLPALGPHDVRVRMKAVGICGSDVHYLKTMMSCAGCVVKEPMVIGHECAGVVEDVGSEVKSLVPGDRVALEPGISCWCCSQCKGGRYNICPEMKFFSRPPVHGSLANQVVHPAYLCFKLPENVSLEEGAMCEPLSVGVHACRRAAIGPETNVLIMGAGPIGLVTMLAARAFRAPRIVMVDVDDHRLSVAKSLGADDVVTVSPNVQVVHPAYLCFKLPENVSLEEGAMCEPLSVGVHACRRAAIGPETNVLIMGAGPIGLVTMLAARAFRAPRIVMVDVDDHRLSVAKSLGADDVVTVSPNVQDIDEEATQIQNKMGTEVDVVIDCAGFSKTVSTALNVARAGGKVCLVGMGQNEMTVPLTLAAAREVDIIGVFRYKDTWPLCLEFLRSGKIDVKPLITHRFGFSQQEVEAAFEVSARGRNAIKVMFNL